MEIKLHVEGASSEQIARYKEILAVMLKCGALDGVRGGATLLHFDKDGVFQQLTFNYSPWKRRKGVAIGSYR